MRKPGPDVHMLNNTVYAIGMRDRTLTRLAINDPEDVLSTRLDFTPAHFIAEPDTRMLYFVDPGKTSIYRMPLAFDTSNSKLLS